ncbi:MAG TPA: hypothetical protein VKE74_07860, partial [Gemmataceae bacterium]|nr:hypothetical protein [Gemmataceae bacterium]
MSGRLNVSIRWAAAALVLGLTVMGCGGSTSKVRGKVTHNGKTVVWGSVTLVDKNGEFHQADIDLNGNYVIEKVPFGTVKIAVASPNPEPPRGRGDQGRGGAGGKIEGLEDPREQFMAGKEK